MKKILIIEDNKEISNNIKEYLELEKFEITQAFDWEIGLDTAKSKNFDLILLDLMLPEIDWITIARKLNWRIETPIIMITAKDSINQKLEWFKNGAIDYIVKPFDLRELEARIKANLKINSNSQKLNIWKIKIDLDKRDFIKNWKK